MYMLLTNISLAHSQTHKAVFLIVVILSFLIVPPVLAQEIDAEVDFYLVPPEKESSLTVGDYITLRLDVTHPPNSVVTLPQIDEEEPWGDLEIIEQTESTTVQHGDGTATTSKDIIVAVYAPGQYQTEDVVVIHQKRDGTIEDLGAPVVPINVASVLVEGDTELRDLKDQAELPVPPIWPWIVLGVLAAFILAAILTALGLWLYHYWQRQQALGPDILTPVIVDTRPPEVIAYAELDRIETLDLPAKNQLKDHYSLVTDCLRKYIEGRYHISALEQTSDELQSVFAKSAKVSAELARTFMTFFVESDFVKFARYRPQPDDAYGLIDNARNIVELTTPTPPEDLTETIKHDDTMEVVV